MGIKGAILGDIIGSCYEATPCHYPKTVPLFTKYNRFTDDTILSIAVKLALDSGVSFADSYREVCKNYEGRGFGPGFKMWLHNDPNFHQSIGNGSAMRVSYIGDIAKSKDEVILLAEKSAVPTHNTEEGITGAVVIAMCCYLARAHSKKEILKFASEYYPEIKNTPYDKLNYGWSAVCRYSVPLAVRCFIDSTSFEDCMRKIIGIHCDADTVCAMAGGIAENYYGETVKDADKIIRKYLTPELCNCLYAHIS